MRKHINKSTALKERSQVLIYLLPMSFFEDGMNSQTLQPTYFNSERYCYLSYGFWLRSQVADGHHSRKVRKAYGIFPCGPLLNLNSSEKINVHVQVRQMCCCRCSFQTHIACFI